MKKIGISVLLMSLLSINMLVYGQRGYYDAPYTRYEADAGALSGNHSVEGPTYNQADMAFEASDRKAVHLKNGGAVEWNVSGNFNRMGIVLRYSVAGVSNHTENRSAQVEVWVNNNLETTLTIDTKYSWEDLMNNGNYNNVGISNPNWRMRYDEVRYRIDSPYSGSTKVKLVSKSDDLWIDFVEVENVNNPIAAPAGYTVYSGNGNDLQVFLDNNGGNIYIPEGVFNIPSSVNIGQNRTIQGAGMWYTNLNFTSKSENQGGIWSYFTNNLKDLSLNTEQSSRSDSYKGINGPWGQNSLIENVWVEHFECGAWIANYNEGYGNPEADGLTIRHCRFRNNYADGINFCKGSKNCVAEHSSFRNNGDDDMAIWPANGQVCHSNTYRYNTAENNYRSSSVALYGGYGNKWHNILIKDNYEVGIRVSSMFPGAQFQEGASNEIYEIDVIGCGTPYNTYQNPDPAVDIISAGNGDVHNVKLTCVNLIDSKFDAIFFKKQANRIRNVSLDGVNIMGADRYGQTQNDSWGGAAGIRFVDGAEIENVTFCGSFSNVQGEEVAEHGKPSGWSVQTSGCASCGEVEVVNVTGVSLNESAKTVDLGESFSLNATVNPNNASNKAVVWTSSNSGVASVSNGAVTALSAGTSVITVTTADGGFTASCNVTVKSMPVSGVTVSSPIDLPIGGSATINYTVNPANAANKNVTFSIVSGNSHITLNGNVVTASSVGAAVVRVTTQDGNKTADCTINVTDAPACADENVIVKTTVAPNIDGVADNLWNYTGTQPIMTQVINNGETNGYNAQWKGLYSDSHLYFLVELQKPSATSSFYNKDSDNDGWWNGSDAVQFFFDRSGVVDLNLIYSGDEQANNPVFNVLGQASAGVNVQAKKIAAGKISIEVALPWSSVGLAPSDNGSLKMDVAVTLANSVERIAQFTSYSTDENVYQSVAGYGVVETKMCNIPSTSIAASGHEKSIVARNNAIEVSGLKVGEIVSVYNLLGTKVFTLTSAQSEEVIVGLSSGVYVVVIEGTGLAKKVLVKN